MTEEKVTIHDVGVTCLGLFGGWVWNCSCGRQSTGKLSKEQAERLAYEHLLPVAPERAKEFALTRGVVRT